MRTIVYILAAVVLVASAFLVGITIYATAKVNELQNKLRTAAARGARWSKEETPEPTAGESSTSQPTENGTTN